MKRNGDKPADRQENNMNLRFNLYKLIQLVFEMKFLFSKENQLEQNLGAVYVCQKKSSCELFFMLMSVQKVGHTQNSY
jgi:hypothetical protein